MNANIYHMEQGFTDRRALEELKLGKLKKQIQRVYDNSPFHKERFDLVGFRPEMLKRPEDLKDVPFFDKNQERASQAESQKKGLTALGMHIACDPRDVQRISSTSGTTGNPTFTGYTQNDSEVTAEIMRRAMPIMNAKPGDIVMHAFVLSMWIAGVPVVDIMQMAGLCVVPIGGTSGAERFAITAKSVMPKQLNCTPSYAVWMAKELQNKYGIDPAEFGFERVLLAGEPGGSIQEVREEISRLWGGVKIYDGIGAMHSSFFSSFNCDHNTGLHFLAEDFVHLELIDPTTGELLPLEDGVSGEAVYTALDKECAPAIRFRSGDRFALHRGPCACGRDTLRYHVEGRTDDMLLVRGVNVFPAAIKAIVSRFGDRGVTNNMRVVLTSKPPVQEPPLEIRVELGTGLPDETSKNLAAEMSAVISKELRFKCQITLQASGTLDAFQQDKNQKQQVFIKEY
ncbi:phenylacetate--CoA ligase family protein [Sneathiella aquimaris]|uniref:phenylacetate--CoA ligase family protein n=1 Tax=Sneathiella aquimaris TaxID=2599305 RepID=UPI001469A996|nr:hypothetical protein [Sneathiella aquimaris]